MSKRQATPQDLMDKLLSGSKIKKSLDKDIKKSVNNELKGYRFRVTIDLSENEIDKLQEIRKQRIKQGAKRSDVNNSMLIREAIMLLE